MIGIEIAVVRWPRQSGDFPGHGAKADVTVLDADAEYIKTVIPILDGAASADEAKAAIKAKYAAHGGDFRIGFSVDNYFAACKKAL